MADDWIKMRHNLRDDPAVIAIASAICPQNVPTSDDVDLIIGKLHRIWCWFDQQTRDGIAKGISQNWIDFYVGRSGFAAAMADVGWLIIRSKSIEMPGFDSHNGASAKKRASDAKRKRMSRNCPGNVREVSDKNRTRGEERREDKNNTNTPPIVPQEKVSEELQNLGHWWNRLKAAGLVPAGVNAASPSDAVRKGWAKCQRIPELRALIKDLDRLEAEIRLADICREGWFRLEKLLGAKNRAGAFIVEVLAEGGYRTSRKGSGQLDFSAIGGGEYVGPE